VTVPSLLHHYLEQGARRVPGRPAVQFRSEELTYEQLFRAAGGLARTLMDHGITSGERVAIWLPKGIEAIASIHGVLIAGAAYVPIDPAGPVARAAYVLRDCEVACVITTQDHFELLGTETALLAQLRLVVIVGDNRHNPEGSRRPLIVSWAAALKADSISVPVPAADPHHLAYVLYTSGSSGTPKGVMLSHQNGDAVVQWACQRFRFDQSDRIASHAPLHFDLSIIDVFCAARAGATLVLVPDHQRMFGAALVRFIVAERITVWYSVPGALVALLDATNNELLGEAALRIVLYAGEAFPPRRLGELLARLPTAQVYNLYGPTETNVCTWHQVRTQDVAGGAVGDVPIGRLCEFAVGHVIDEDGAPAVLIPGVRGELAIGGSSVMIGYWGGLSATESSVARGSEFTELGGRIHRTGDLVHVNVDGSLVFDGRMDDMVKIRGYRVEPAEVETAILASADVSEACVVAVAGDDGVSHLEAYVVAGKGRDIDLSAVQRICSDKLPRYMLPDRISCIPELPRGATGKVDRRRLMARSHETEGIGGDGV
jgi:amino acid adenylation domain-containing protein